MSITAAAAASSTFLVLAGRARTRAAHLRASGMELRPFIEGVCTKGGTTAAGMVKLGKPAFKKIVADTLAAAAARSRELA